ncbi:Disease resistance protein RPP8 [Rhynchospora pubera]|uniref:Disease resistance protein RPP8 n=1 Tax=Rhynchospora pubera TaxID=906938 RepID=A0AAV8DVH4_9POAL|nr:Disease resistance protein RPP8 [Rhynchospora pubera]
MAETVVNFVLGKLGEIIAKEAQFLGEVGGKVKWVETELTRIKCYLTDADNKRRQGDARAENYLNELRDLAYRIEDAIDIFYVEIEDNRQGNMQKDHSWLGKLKKLGRKTTKLPALHNLGTELDEIRNMLEGIFDSSLHYQINPLQERGKEEIVPMPFRRATYQNVDDETEVVGFGTHKKKVLKLILDSETRRRAVVTIVGCGGVGKTTLAQMIYKSVQADFDVHVMLPVSQQYNHTDFLRMMLTELRGSEPTTQDIDELKGSETRTQDIDVLVRKLRSFLRSKRYLIILDDVWVTDLWNQYLKYALPDAGNGSRVLMTSRFIQVAQSADPIMEPYELEFLNEEDSRNLLIKKALPYQNPDEKCPDDLLKLADALSKKCKGLPLALVVLGGILSIKDPYPEWEKVLRTMDWSHDGKECIKILSMSYEDMPCYLKTCFLYLASFPEDYEISAKCLIRMWVAEGFMPQQGRKTMEEIAEEFLQQLFQRSMVQVSSRHVDGSIKYCRLHDLLRDFAIHQATKENFVTVFENPQNINYPDTATRRASLQSCGPQFIKNVGPKTRSLFLFGPKCSLPNYSGFRLLRVLEIVNVWNGESIKLREVDTLIHLKYLGVKNYKLDMSEFSFGRLKNLETLDFVNSGYRVRSNLPTDLWTIITLRHVIYNYLLPELPSTIDLRNLQTLEWIPFNNKPIPHLNNLRRLGLENESTEWDVDHAVPHLLEGLPSVTSLQIKSWKQNLPMEIVYPRALPNYNNLQILSLNGKWSESVTLKARLFPPHLIKLTLWDSKLGQDPMWELGKLKNLRKLKLIGNVYDGNEMSCSAGFSALETLELHDIRQVEVLSVEKGVMPKLKDLWCYYCIGIRLKMPPELKHLIQQRGEM